MRRFSKKGILKKNNIHVITLNKNMGFARGNNIGFKYAVEKLKSDMIILCNSDIEITQKRFFEKIESIYKETNFALFGPDIRRPDEGGVHHQNPKMINAIIDWKFINQEILKLKYTTNKSILFSYLAKIPPLGFLRKKLQKNRITSRTPASRIDNRIMLYGAFLVFSKEYIKIFPEGLFDRTFMYGEEHALTYRIQMNDLCQVYSSDVFVYHFEGKSTLSERTKIERTRFLRNEGVKSLTKVKQLIEETQDLV